jgi:hypothetical protein
MDHFYPSQALDDPTPLALELENIPHCQKHKHKLKISVKVGYIRDKGFSLHDSENSKSQVTHSTLEFCEY